MEASTNPLDHLPDGLSLDYLRKITTLSSAWEVRVCYTDELEEDKAAGLEWDAASRQASVLLNCRYYFSARALARAIAHELLELNTINTWIAYLKLTRKLTTDVRQLSDADRHYRQERDRQIDGRLASIPWWDPWDVPVPCTCLDDYAFNRGI